MLEKKKTIHISTGIKAFLLAILSSFALVVENGAHKIPENVEKTLSGQLSRYIWKLQAAFESPSYYVLFFVILAFFAFLYLIPKVNKKNIPWGVPFSCIAALFLLLCDSYYQTDSWDKVFGSWEALITSGIKGIGIAVLVFFVYDVINRINIEKVEKVQSTSTFKTFAVLTAIMFACWIPYMVIMAPGCMNPDARDQFGQMLNNPDMCWSVGTVAREESDSLLTNHHPVFHTVLLGCFLKLGEWMGSYFAGITIYSVLQCLVLAGTLVFSVLKLREYGMSKRLSNIVYAFFVLCPLFPLWGMTILKDTPFMIALLIMTILFYEAFKAPECFTAKKYVALALVSFLLMLLRNNGFYMLLVLVPFVIIHFRKDKKFLVKIMATMLIPLLVFKVGYSSIFFSAMGINEGSPREMLSVPFQQTARYITEYADEVTPEEEKSITTILGGGKLSLEDIAERYTPDRADSIKGNYNKYATTSDLVNYFKTWAAQLVKHPGVYIEAFLNLNYSWFSFDSNHDIIYYNGVSDQLIPQYVEGLDNPQSLAGERSIVSQTIKLLDKIPVISSIFELSTYTWIYVVLFLAMLMRKKHRELLACLPIFINMVICFIGPVAYMRYSIPLVICLPIVFFITFSKKRNKAAEDNKDEENAIWIK
ncbi:MAG TPA: hypothetical protein IAD23_04525 [Candidatus Scubalenecus merdavium]|uniref:Uncharacterized protein n=1 Tax=Candidatus Scybalenecus merdavium TaxID=2840939 RepID=A0A9D1MUK7_9FIRM|nr:hypothetical protein [Candidatus Scubalenecus merdavium]